VVAPVSATYSLYDSVGVVVVNAGVATVTAGSPPTRCPRRSPTATRCPRTVARELGAHRAVGRALADDVRAAGPALPGRADPARHGRVAVPDARQWRNQLPKSRANYNEPIEDAWGELIGRLLGDGHLPNRILNNHALATCTSTGPRTSSAATSRPTCPADTKWSGLADNYWKRSQDEYENHLGLQADQDEDGVAEQPGVLESAEPPLYATDVPWTDFPFGGPRRDW
jgi:hypothetical protein